MGSPEAFLHPLVPAPALLVLGLATSVLAAAAKEEAHEALLALHPE